MRLLVVVVAVLAVLGLAAFGVTATHNAAERGGALLTRLAAPRVTTPPMSPPSAAGSPTLSAHASGTASGGSAPAPSPAAPTSLAQSSNPTAPNASRMAAAAAGTGQTGAGSPSARISHCDNPEGMGLSRTVQVDTTGGPAFGVGHFQRHEFLRDKEVVLTFDDGPRLGTTAAVLKALADQCLKATFFELGERAIRYPEIVREVAAAGNTIGSYTWSYQDLARSPYATDLDAAETEIEMGTSAVRMAAGAPTAPFFRFPDLREPPPLLSYLGKRNIAIFSTDIDSFDSKFHRPQQIIDTVMTKLKERGNGIILLQDFQIATAQALPDLLRQLKLNGYKVVHMVPKDPVATLAKYDDMVRQQQRMGDTGTRPGSGVVTTVGGR